MRILILGLNFSPELTGIGKYTGEMAEFLSQNGFDVRVITTPPYYPHWKVQAGYTWWRYRQEKWGAIWVIRCPLWVPRKPSGLTRVLYLGSFAVSSIPALIAQIAWRPEVVMCIAPALANAPFAIGLARVTRSLAWLHIQDFELDAAENLGMLPGSHFIVRATRRIEQWLLTRFDRVSTISNRMLARLVQKGVSPNKTYLFPNWVNTDVIFPIAVPDTSILSALGVSSQNHIVLYSGNMGHKHGLEYLVAVARELQTHSNITFLLCGAGAARPELERAAGGLPNLHFLPLQPIEKLNHLLNLADIHILSQRAGAADLVMPSKLTGMLASGKVVIATADPGTEIAAVVGQVGVVVPPENAQALAQAILDLTQDSLKAQTLGKMGHSWVLRHWSHKQVLQNFTKLLSQKTSS
jgi:colanic acid biosynthesis glycosyl transferase WcaI